MLPRVPDSWTEDRSAAWRQCREVVNKACDPSSHRDIIGELAKMRVSMAKAAQGEDDMQAMTAVFVDDLAGYPPDVIATACRRWRRTQRFFPTPADLIAICDELFSRRRMLRDAFAKDTK